MEVQRGRPSRSFEINLQGFLSKSLPYEKREHVIATLYSIAVDKKHHKCVEAGKLLLAYCWGRPTEHVEVTRIQGRDAQVNSARTSYVLAAIPAIQAQNPEWNAEQVTQEAELQFDAWMASLQADRPALIDVESTA